MHLFETALSVPVENIEIELRGHAPVQWSEFLLNPRRLRGSDFLMRWSQGVWSEERLTQAVNGTGSYFALPYGPSGTAPDDDPRAFELYFERLELAGLGRIKRPDLLIFRKEEQPLVNELVNSLGGVEELPFTLEDDRRMKEILEKALIAVECENSLWRAKRMPGYGAELTPQRRLEGRPGLKKTAVLPTIIMKEEDRAPLLSWQEQSRVKIHIWHVFYDLAFGISLDRAEELIAGSLIEPTVQTFQAPGGATQKKVIYKFYYHYAYPLGEAGEEPTLLPAHIEDKNGHILPYVRFVGGSLILGQEALDVLSNLSE
ncbi:MAG: AccI family restriction endonuclease [Rubrivivax sp.]|nr:AccI family restriction endonuclease [Pyrinomonadaceae bacterium]